MNNSNDQTESEVKKAAEKADAAKLKDNLEVQNDDNKKAESLDSDEKTPFIEESLRTDDK